MVFKGPYQGKEEDEDQKVCMSARDMAEIELNESIYTLTNPNLKKESARQTTDTKKSYNLFSRGFFSNRNKPREPLRRRSKDNED